MAPQNEQDIIRPITIMLDGPASYHAWSQNMTVFLKGRKLWRYVTGSIPKPIPKPKSIATAAEDASKTATTVDDYKECLEEWESIQSKVLSWFINTSIPSIHNLLPRLETVEVAWKFLVDRYNCTNDSSMEFHIESKLYQMRQETGQSFFDYYSQTSTMWEQLSAADPPLMCSKDIEFFVKYRDRRKFMHFMMGLREDFEPTRASLLSRSPTPSLDATSSKGTHCKFCRAKGHDVSVCRKLQKFVQEQNKASLPRATVVCPSDPSVPTGPSLPSSLTTADIEAVVQQVLSRTAITLSVTSGKQPWFFVTACCNHMTPDESQFSDKAPLEHPTTIYIADGTPLPVSHKGTISSPGLSLSDTFHIPKLSLNLLSVGQLCELGADLLFTNHGVDVQDPQTGQVLGTGRKVGRIFEVHDLKIPSQIVSAAATTATPSPNLWHARLSHPSLSRFQLLAYQDSHGTLPQRSCPYTSQQNGRVERKHRHILDVVRTLVISASLPERFWGEAVLTAVYTINCIPSPTTHKKSPFELLYDQTPDYSSLRVFGCACFVSLSPHERTKLQPQSPIFTNLFLPLYPELVEDSSTLATSPDDSSPVLSQAYDPPVLDPVAPPFPELPVGPELCRSTRVSIPPPYLTDYHCSFALATFYEPHTYRETHTDPLW
ncbi:uncharacterized protein LOC142634878 [Castanea sativa]|uniref:uncharacterized protein LOC142634878 n=1 Tax=Castanea sativa TaxID=21020 RepID=UPI003F64BFB7